MVSALAKRIEYLEPLAQAASGTLEKSVYGVVDYINEDGTPHFIRRWKGTIGNMVPTLEDPTIFLIEKLEPCILKHKKYKCLFGGRAGTKSIMTWDVMAGDVNSCGSKVFCLRERMKSLKESIYAGISGRISQVGISGYTPVPSQWEIRHRSGGKFTFGGMQNIVDMKGSFNYKYFLMEEAERTTQETIDLLGPTLRGVDGAELWYVWNPASATDAMSNEFITPYQAELDRDGFYEDDYHLIIKVCFEDNPWFMGDESLRTEYLKDKSKMECKLMSKSRFRHIWHGEFNDNNVDNSLIEPDWFDACIDAHKKLGIEPKGAVVASHDPADVGQDSKAIMVRHGIVFIHAEEIDAVNGNIGFDMACGVAKKLNANMFNWDCDGMGALLREQAAVNFKNTPTRTSMFKGSEAVHYPEAICAFTDNYGIHGAKKNKDVFRNKRAQNYVGLAERCRKTYDAVVNKTYHNPDDLVSFSSEHISPPLMRKLRSELCQLPVKANASGTIELYTKDAMKKGILMSDGSRIKLPSPNLGDCVMMSFDAGTQITITPQIKMPRPLQSMGAR